MTKTDKRFWILLIPIIIISCNSNPKEADTKSANDFQRVDNFMLLKAENQSVDDVTDEITVDTIINGWHIRFKQLPNERVISRHFDYADNSLFVDLEYNGFKIVDCKEFRSENFIPENDTITAYQLYGSSISQVEDSVITLSFVCCIPDTDIGYDVSLKFDTQGTYSYKVTYTIDFYSEE